MTTHKPIQPECGAKLLGAIEYAYFSKPPYFNHKKSGDTNQHLIENADILIAGYHKYSEKISSEHQRLQDYNKRYRKSFETKTCFCGSRLTYLFEYSFWGCRDYKLPYEHVKYYGREPSFYNKRVSIPSTWMVDIIKEAGLHGKVRAKEFYYLLIQNSLPDLRLRYGNKSSESTFNGYTIAKTRSKIQEQEAQEKIASLYPKYVYQQCITYKLMGYQQSFCIPDFIAGDENHVLVADAKLDAIYIDDDKMDLYTALVEFIIRGKDDERFVTGCHVLYNNDNYGYAKNSRYSTFII